ncbi:MAG: hypothetical protein ABR502_08590 [Chitinophagaceae bacterium]
MKENYQNSSSGDSVIELRLWGFIDETIPPVERSEVEKLITENATWRSKYQELLQVNELIHSSELEQPSLRFTKNVMEQIVKYQIAPATKKYINNKLIWGIAAFFIIVIIGFVIYGISQVDWSAETNESVAGIGFTAVDYSNIFNNTFVNVFMMANVILGLMLLERYLSNKNKQLQQEL